MNRRINVKDDILSLNLKISMNTNFVVENMYGKQIGSWSMVKKGIFVCVFWLFVCNLSGKFVLKSKYLCKKKREITWSNFIQKCCFIFWHEFRQLKWFSFNIYNNTRKRKNKKKTPKQHLFLFCCFFERLLKLYFRIRRVMFLMVVCFTNSGILLMLVFWHKFVKHWA